MSEVRTRAWRRFKSQLNANKGKSTKTYWKPEKNWKMMYTRSEKLIRAKQLGFEYPRKKLHQIAYKAKKTNE